MGFFQRRSAAREMMARVSHPMYAPEFTGPEARALLATGIRADLPMPEGWTPLAHICVWNNIEVARVLIEHHADPDGRPGDSPKPLAIAATNGHLELVNLLYDAGADVNARDGGSTALHRALGSVDARRAETAELLIELGADPHAQNSSGQTPLEEYRETYRVLVNRKPMGNETQADRDAENRELTEDLHRFTLLFARR